MTLDEFIKEFNHKAVDYDRVSGVQCVDTAKMYIKFVLDIEPQMIGNANEYVDRYYELPYLYENFALIVPEINYLPIKGDLVVWDKSFGKYGHIAIATGNNDEEKGLFEVFEQNGASKELLKAVYPADQKVAIYLRPRNQDAI